MKILLTGKNGYVAKSLYSYLANKHAITSIGRLDFDLANSQDVKSFMKDKHFDVVIHTAIKGGSRLKVDDVSTFYENMLCFYNLYDCKSSYERFITFGSGAEVAARDTQYGLSKRCISDIIRGDDRFTNLRIFAVFDENELDQRFIKSNIIRYIKKEPMVIHQDKFMDFFYMQDLCKLVEHYIDSDGDALSELVECSYNKKYRLLDIAKIINNLSDYKVSVVVENEGLAQEYIGKESPDMDFIGLEKGIQITYNKLKKLF